jgi:hypothetical protein
MASLYWRIKLDGKWKWVAADEQNTVGEVESLTFKGKEDTVKKRKKSKKIFGMTQKEYFQSIVDAGQELSGRLCSHCGKEPLNDDLVHRVSGNGWFCTDCDPAIVGECEYPDCSENCNYCNSKF